MTHCSWKPRQFAIQPERGDTSTNALSPSEARLAGTISETGELQVHGLTSTLHSRTETENHGFGSPEIPTNNVDKEIAKAQLFSNAAIQRQKEANLSPNCGFNLNINFNDLPLEFAFHLLNIH
ncbi:hypothetical protein BDZ45DRAFT_795801 [Acephala macrosclerotiorum]|nr:hypothetical protein BDZ45DRAFT_795801 [Acephala macrosclerotiorum]